MTFEEYIRALEEAGKLTYTNIADDTYGVVREYGLNDSNAGETPWAEWPVDFEISFNKAVPADAVTIYGNYANYGWIGLPVPATAAGTVRKLLENLPGSPTVNYSEMAGIGQFSCAATYNGAETDLTVTVELVAYEGTTRHVINTYVFRFGQTKYTVTFVNEDGTVLQSGDVALGETPAYTGETPTKAADAQYTYSFDGWTPAVSAVAGDVTYTATYKKTVNKYTVKFVGKNDAVLQEEELEYGATPVYNGGTPARIAVDGYEGYAYFTGWDKEIVTVTEDATYTAVFYTFEDYVDELEAAGQASYGNIVDTEHTIAREYKLDDDNAANTPWAEWPVDFELSFGRALKANELSIYGKYEPYDWIGGALPAVAEGTVLKLLADIRNENVFTYTDIAGIVKDFKCAPEYNGLGDLTVTVELVVYEDDYRHVVDTYTVTLAGMTFEEYIRALEEAGKLTYTNIADDTYGVVREYGLNDSNAGETPWAEWPVDFEISFNKAVPAGAVTIFGNYANFGWVDLAVPATTAGTVRKLLESLPGSPTVNYSEMAGIGQFSCAATYNGAETDLTVTVELVAYEGTTRHVINTYVFRFGQASHTVTFVNYDGTVLQSGETVYGQTPVFTGETPTKAADAQYTYVFAGWSPEITAVTEDATYTATYTPVLRKYTVKFVNYDGLVLQSGLVEYGTLPEYENEEPTKPADPSLDHTCTPYFFGWDKEIVEVTEDATYTAVFYTFEGYVDELKKEGKVSYTSAEGKGNEREYKLEDDNAANTPWAEWPVDIELSFDKDVAAGSVTFYGKYQNYDNGTEVSQVNADQITAGTVYRLLRDLRGEIVYDFDYEVMAGFVQDFIGGARYDGNDEVTVTVKLIAYENAGTASEIGHVVDVYEYTFSNIVHYVNHLKGTTNTYIGPLLGDNDDVTDGLHGNTLGAGYVNFEINDAEAGSYKGMKVEGGRDLLLNGRQYSLDDPNADTCEYKDYVIDYEVSFDKAIAAGEVVLLGNYGPFGWTPIPSIAIAANTPIRLLANSGAIYGTQFTMTYYDLATVVRDFCCGAIYKGVPEMTMTIDLVAYETENGVETGKSWVIDHYTYTFSETDTPFDFTQGITGNTTIYAKWTEAYARIGETLYRTLEEAFAAAVDGDTVTLLKDISQTEPVSVSGKITLDMAGKTVTYATTAATKNDYVQFITVESGGELTITGNGTINGPANGATYDGKQRCS
jgi:alkyl hydroperoxide reductase subunit AhpC